MRKRASLLKCISALAVIFSFSYSLHSQSQPTITEITHEGELSWTTEPRHHYQLQKALYITAPTAWTNVGPAVLGTGNLATATDTNVNMQHAFYRVSATNALACTNSGGASFQSATPIGSIRGDTALGAFACPAVCQRGPTRSGCGSGWFRLRLIEESSCIAALRIDIQLQPPLDADYNLYLYDSNGDLLNSSESATGAVGNLFEVFSDAGLGEEDSRDLWIEVRHISGASFGTWTLRTSGGSGPCY